MIRRTVALALACTLAGGTARAQELDAEGRWLAYADPAQAGYDAAAIDALRSAGVILD